MAIVRSGFLRNNAGVGIVGATVELFAKSDTDQSTPLEGGAVRTIANGFWTLSHSDEGQYDIRITSGSSVRFHHYDVAEQMEELEVNVLKIRDSNNSHTYEIIPADLAANRTITLPLLTTGDTFAVLGLAQTFTADQTLNDSVALTLGTGGDVDVEYDGTDLIVNARVVGTGNVDYRQHLTWGGGVAMTAGDYAIGRNADGTNLLQVNVPTGASLEISINDGATATFSASGLNLASGDGYSIAATSVLSATTLGTEVLSSSLTTVGALNSGSITSGFGAIDNGASAITTTGALTGGVTALTGTLDAESYASIGNGSAISADLTMVVDRDFSTTATASELKVSGIITVTGGTSDVYYQHLSPQGVVINSGNTHGIVASFYVEEPVITETSGSVTTAATMLIVGAPTEGGSNYSLLVDAGAVRFDDNLEWGAGVAVTAGNYSIGRNADGTNLLQLNVPTGASFELSVNDVAEALLSATAFNLSSGNTYQIDATDVLSATTLGGAVVASSLTSVGTLTALTMGGTIDMANNTLDNPGAAGNTWTAASITHSGGAGAGATQNIQTQHTDNTNAASHAKIQATVGGASGGDPYVEFLVTATSTWVVGVDNSAGDIFIIGDSATLGGNDAFRISNATPPVINYNTSHPTGVFDYVCDGCGKSDAEPFLCCDEVRWHDDVMDYRAMVLRQPGALDYMERIGVITRNPHQDTGEEEIFTTLGRDVEFAWAMSYQNRQYVERLESRLVVLERMLT
jgi:hypothetical protein